MKKVTLVIRILFGIMLLGLGIVELFHLSGSTGFSGEAKRLIDVLVASGYFFPIILSDFCPSPKLQPDPECQWEWVGPWSSESNRENGRYG